MEQRLRYGNFQKKFNFILFSPAVESYSLKVELLASTRRTIGTKISTMMAVMPAALPPYNMIMKGKLSSDSKAYYSIQLQGVLDQSWADQYGDLRVMTFPSQDTRRPPVTTIVGEVFDQAALTGFLNLAHDLGMPLISVTYIG